MVDKIMYKNSNEVWIIFDHRKPIVVATDNGTALKLAMDILGWLDFVNADCVERIGKL